MHPSPLPRDLRTAPFTVREGEDGGVTRERMRAGDLDRSVWGVRSTKAAVNLRDRCALFAVRLPSTAVFSHTTAALLLGAPLPFEFERDSRVHVSMPAPARAPHAAGIVGHRLDLVPGDVTSHSGIRLTSAARTWCDLGAMLSLPDLVAVGDYLIHWRTPRTTIDELAEYLPRLSGARGARMLRRSHGLLNDRAESRPESRLRVIIVTAGLPQPHINYEIVDTETGKDVRTDVAFASYRVLLEYQGDYHRTRTQWRKDMTRRSRLEAKGWIVMELNADDLRDPEELATRIRTMLRRQGWTG